MSTRDSGVIDLFAIHKEEEERVSAAPSGPPPAVSYDTSSPRMGDDLDVDALAVAQQSSRLRAKIVGGAIGGMAVIGIVMAAIFTGPGTLNAKDVTATASQLPPSAVTVPAPAAAPAPAPTQEAAKEDDKPMTRSQAIAAVKGTQGKAKKHFAAKAAGAKLQKVQSWGTN